MLASIRGRSASFADHRNTTARGNSAFGVNEAFALAGTLESSANAARHAWLHRDDGATRAIADEDEVWVETPRGRGAIEVNMGGGGPLGSAAWQEPNVNDLTDLDNRGPISGFPIYKALLCDVNRVTEECGRWAAACSLASCRAYAILFPLPTPSASRKT